MYGDDVYVTIRTTSNAMTIRLHRNGSAFNYLEVMEDNDDFPAFWASEILKDLFVSFLKSLTPVTISAIESVFGDLYDLSSKQMCLAVLTTLLWSYPSNPSPSPNYAGSFDFYGIGSITYKKKVYNFNMQLSVNGSNVIGRYIVTNGANEWVDLSGTVDNTGRALVYEYNNGTPTNYYFEGDLRSSFFVGEYKSTSSKLVMDFHAFPD